MCGLRQNGFQFPLQFSNRYLFVTYIRVLKKTIQKSIFNLRQPFLTGSSLACLLVFSFLLCCFLNYVNINPFTEIFSNSQPTLIIFPCALRKTQSNGNWKKANGDNFFSNDYIKMRFSQLLESTDTIYLDHNEFTLPTHSKI